MATAVAATAAMVAAAAVAERPKAHHDSDDDGGPPPAHRRPLHHPPPATQTQKTKDLLDTTVLYLKQREGIDKTLKIIRYTARLVAASLPPSSAQQQQQQHKKPSFSAEARARAESVQAALGSARKAYRLGKFLQHVSAWRRLPPIDYYRCLTDPQYRRAQLRRDDLLERGQVLGEGCYYFLDQAAFYFKAGAFGERAKKGAAQRRLALLSAWCETVGYACNIALGFKRVRELGAAEARLRAELVARYRASAGGGGGGAVGGAGAGGALLSAGGDTREAVARLKQLAAARRLRAAAIAQDAADALLALSDILPDADDGGGGSSLAYRRARKAVSHPVLLALCGLLSAAVSTQKNWRAVAGGGGG
jgi:hypothetical protein